MSNRDKAVILRKKGKKSAMTPGKEDVVCPSKKAPFTRKAADTPGKMKAAAVLPHP